MAFHPKGRAMLLRNAKVMAHPFLHDMRQDSYFPAPLVEQGRQILLRLCERIEREPPVDAAALCALTHAATLEFNVLGEAFEAQGSELESVARDNIGSDVDFIARSYGFDVDVEDLISPREW